jgi:hypothetical protein
MKDLRARITPTFRRAALPLASYYAVTLGLPIARGAASSEGFLEHAVAVLTVPVLLILAAAGIGQAVAACRGRRRSRRYGARAIRRSSPGSSQFTRQCSQVSSTMLPGPPNR